MSMTTQRDVQLKFVNVDELVYSGLRDIRPGVVEEINERIESAGYNPAKPMRVVPIQEAIEQGLDIDSDKGSYVVGDGNHRLKTLQNRDWSGEVACVVEREADIYELSVESNRDEDTYAEQDLFDYLDYIDRLRDEHTQAEIGEKLGWGRSKVADHSKLLNSIVAPVLELARQHQEGRATDDVAAATFDFTEYWFRTSGLYDLEGEWQAPDEDEPIHAQVRFIDWFVNEQNCKASKNKVGRKAEQLESIQSQLETLENELNEGVEGEKREEIHEQVTTASHTDDSLQEAIEKANAGAKDQAHFGHNSVEKLQDVEDNSIACVVTDPPYGVEYKNHRDSGRPEFGEDAPEALDLVYDVFEQLERVCKANAHLYVFFPTKLYAEFTEVATEFFEIDEVPLVWVKNNIAPTRDAENGFKKRYAQQYETVLHLRAEKGDSRELNGKSSSNVLEHDIPKNTDRWHDSQKPISLWEELITNSTNPDETILDPFAGSGSSLLAAKKAGRHYVGIEKSEEYESRFKREARKLGGSE